MSFLRRINLLGGRVQAVESAAVGPADLPATVAYTDAANVFTRAQAVTLGTVTSAASVAFTATWNNAAVTFEAFECDVTDTNSAAASKLLNLKVGGTSRFSVTKAGVLTVTPSAAVNSNTITGDAGVGGGVCRLRSTGSNRLCFDGILAASGAASGWEVDATGKLTATSSQGYTILATPNTPAQITADQDDYNPTGSSPRRHIRLSSDASRNVTSFSINQSSGQEHFLYNVGSFDIVLVNAAGTGTASNRILTSSGADITMTPGAVVFMMYDGTTQRWRAGLLS